MKKNLFLVLIMILFVGCGIKRTIVEKVPYANEVNLQNIFVVHNQKDKHYCDKDIVQLLQEKGYKATSGNLKDMPENTTAVIDYVDRWKWGGWSLSMYLVQISLTIRDPKNNYPIASSTYLNMEGVGTHFQKDVIEDGLDVLLRKLKEEK